MQAPKYQGKKCVDTLAGCKFQKELAAIPLDYGIGGFAQTFCDFFPTAKQQLALGRSLIRVNLLWSDTHSFGDKDIKAITKEAKRYQPLCLQYPGKIQLAPFTEHNLSNPDKYLDIVQANAPNCAVINTPWKGSFSKKYLNEIHGLNHKKPSQSDYQNGAYQLSYDGTSTVDTDVSKALIDFSDSRMFCVWHPRLNLRYRNADTAGRPQRIKEAADRKPSAEFLKSLVYLFSDKGIFSIPNKWLVKTHADKHDANDKKGDKLLIISPVKAAAIILKRAGAQVCKGTYYGTFDGGGYRYYFPVMGFKCGANLMVYIANKLYGTINGGFRGPTFRTEPG